MKYCQQNKWINQERNYKGNGWYNISWLYGMSIYHNLHGQSMIFREFDLQTGHCKLCPRAKFVNFTRWPFHTLCWHTRDINRPPCVITIGAEALVTKRPGYQKRRCCNYWCDGGILIILRNCNHIAAQTMFVGEANIMLLILEKISKSFLSMAID